MSEVPRPFQGVHEDRTIFIRTLRHSLVNPFSLHCNVQSWCRSIGEQDCQNLDRGLGSSGAMISQLKISTNCSKNVFVEALTLLSLTLHTCLSNVLCGKMGSIHIELVCCILNRTWF